MVLRGHNATGLDGEADDRLLVEWLDRWQMKDTGRDSFAGSRWLQRAYFTDSLDPLRKATRSDPEAFAFDAGALLCA